MRAEDRIAARLLEALEGLDLTSADGRAGIGTLLSEIERACPGAILQQAARIELRAVGWRSPSGSVPIIAVEPGGGRSALPAGG
jgi:hypothetical protein